MEIRALRVGDDLDAQCDLSERAFGTHSDGERAYWRQLVTPAIQSGTFLAAFAGQRPVGAALFSGMRQWWCGRPVPMAGVSSVKVAPEDRGRGIGRQLMTRLLEEMAARGFPLSTLYPATMRLYRSLGWELAGSRYTAVIPGRSLHALMPADPAAGAGGSRASAGPDLRRAGPADAQAVIDVLGRVHQAARTSGPLTWDAASVAVQLGRPGTYFYLCDDGFTSYRWQNDNKDLSVAGVQAVSAETTRALWSVIASHASVAKSVEVWIGPADPLWWLIQERDADIQHRSMWMLRVIDAPAAIAARGFPAAVSLDVPLVINDEPCPANSGHWTLSVCGGKGELARATREHSTALTLGPRGLAALYGGTPVASLRLAGLAVGGDVDADAALDAAFAASAYMLDAF